MGSKTQMDFSKIPVSEADHLYYRRDSCEYEIKRATEEKKEKFINQVPSGTSRRSRQSSGTVKYASRPNSATLTAIARQKRHKLNTKTEYKKKSDIIIDDDSDDGRKMEQEIIDDIEKGL